MLNTVLAKMMSKHAGQRKKQAPSKPTYPGMTRSTAVLVDAQIIQLCDHRGLGRHFLAIAPNEASLRCCTRAPTTFCYLCRHYWLWASASHLGGWTTKTGMAALNELSASGPQDPAGGESGVVRRCRD